MKMFTDCSGPCKTCKGKYGCLAGHGDDDYVYASPEWLESDEAKACAEAAARAQVRITAWIKRRFGKGK